MAPLLGALGTNMSLPMSYKASSEKSDASRELSFLLSLRQVTEE